MTSMMSKSLKRARSRKSKSLPSPGKYVPIREAHIVTRIPLGNGVVSTDSSGNFLTIGGKNVSGSSVYEFQMVNFQWLQDLANHFAYWKLHRAVVHLTPTYEVTSSGTAYSNGVFVLAIQDDPYLGVSTTVGVAGSLENRASGEFEVSRPFALDYKPVGVQAGWLYTDSASSTAASTLRQTSAGTLLGGTALASSLASSNVMRASITLDVSFKGSKAYAPVTLTQPSELKEEKKSDGSFQAKSLTVATATPGSRAFESPPDGYELVEIQRRPSSSVLAQAVRRV